MIQVRVTNMVTGDAGMMFEVNSSDSFKELRFKLAEHLGVLFPCVVLFKQSDNCPLEDGDQVSDVFSPDAPQPFGVHYVNNEGAFKEDAVAWGAVEWIRALEPHTEHGEENLAARALAMDDQFDTKMSDWVEEAILCHEDRSGGSELLHLIQIACAIGVNMNVEDPWASWTLLHTPDIIGDARTAQAIIDTGVNVIM